MRHGEAVGCGFYHNWKFVYSLEILHFLDVCMRSARSHTSEVEWNDRERSNECGTPHHITYHRHIVCFSRSFQVVVISLVVKVSRAQYIGVVR